MIETPVAPPLGTLVDLKRGSLVARGTVAWSSANRCGLRFLSEVSIQDWLAAPEKVEQHRVDDIVALIKAGGAVPSAEDRTAGLPRTNGQLTADLGEVVKLLQDLEDDLCSSDPTLKLHGVKLQHLDIAMQMLRAVATELTPNEHGTTGNAKLRDLRVACAQALSGH
jgi:hypothetical protein